MKSDKHPNPGKESTSAGEERRPREVVGERRKDEDDTLKATTIALPTLGPPSAGDAGLTCGDWLARLRPLIGDLATTALTWSRRSVVLACGRAFHCQPFQWRRRFTRVTWLR